MPDKIENYNVIGQIVIDSKVANKLLKEILGKKVFKELLNYHVEIADKYLGENYSAILGILYSNFNNMVILYISVFLSKGNTLKEIETSFRETYKERFMQNSIEDFYLDYKEYIKLVVKELKKRNREDKQS